MVVCEIESADTLVTVNKDEVETNYVKRWFNTLRQRLGRFTRKTLSFSKRDDMYESVLRLFLQQYNFSHHSTITEFPELEDLLLLLRLAPV